MSLHNELLILVPWLRAHPNATVPEVSKHFGVSEQEVRQYILLLGITGFGQLHGELIDIHYDGDRINLYDTLGLDRPYRFDAMQATCLVAGLEAQRLLPEITRGFSDADLNSAYEKVSATLHRSVKFDFVSDSNSEEVQQALTEIGLALAHSHRLTFDYWNDARDGVEQRVVSPLRVRTEDDQALLDAYCHTNEGWRTFRVSRMSSVAESADGSDLPEADFQPMPVRLVEISVPAARRHLLEQFDLASGPRAVAERIHAEVKVALPQWLAKRVLASARDIQVHSPAEVVTEVAHLVELARLPYLSK